MTAASSGRAASRRPRPGSWRSPAERLHPEVGVQRRSTRRRSSPSAGRQRSEEAHQPEADRDRQGGRRGTPRAAYRVVPRRVPTAPTIRPSGAATAMASRGASTGPRTAHRLRQRRSDLDQRPTDGSAAHRSQRRRTRPATASPPSAAAPGPPCVPAERVPAQGRDRRYPGRSPHRSPGRDRRDDSADSQGGRDRPRRTREATRHVHRDGSPGLQQYGQSLRDATPRISPAMRPPRRRSPPPAAPRDPVARGPRRCIAAAPAPGCERRARSCTCCG